MTPQKNFLLYITNLIIFLLVFSGSNAVAAVGGAGKDDDTKYPLTDFSKPLFVQAKTPIITINLPANPSTGYQWYLLQYDDRLLEPASYQYFPATNKRVGAPGVSSWQFQLKKAVFLVPRVTHMEFEYRRSWEVAGGNRQAITIITSPDMNNAH